MTLLARAIAELRHLLEHDAFLLPPATVERMQAIVAEHDQRQPAQSHHGVCTCPICCPEKWAINAAMGKPVCNCEAFAVVDGRCGGCGRRMTASLAPAPTTVTTVTTGTSRAKTGEAP